MAQQIHQLSYSSVSEFASCPRSWFSHRILGRPSISTSAATFGKDFDEAVGSALHAVKVPRTDLPQSKQEPPPAAGSEVAVEQIHEDVERAVSVYLASPGAWEPRQPDELLETQHPIRISPGQFGTLADFYGASGDLPYPFIGYIDLYRERNNGLTRAIADLKTSSRKGCEPMWILQTCLYAIAKRAQMIEIHQLIKPQPSKAKDPSKAKPGKFRTAFYKFAVTDDLCRWALGFVGYFAKQMLVAESSSLHRLPACPSYRCAWCSEAATCEANLLSGAKPVGGTEMNSDEE